MPLPSRSHRPPLIPSPPLALTTTTTPRFSTPLMASRPPPPPHLHLHLHPSSLFPPPLGSFRCRRGRSRLLSALPSPSPAPSPPSRSQRVSTASLEDRPGPAPSLEQRRGDAVLAAEVSRLSAARARLRAARSVDDKLRVLDAEPRVAAFFGGASSVGVLGALGPREVFLLKCLVAAGQEHVLGAELDLAVGGHEHQCNGGGGGSALREALYSLAGLVEKWGSEGAKEDEAGGEDMELLRQLLKFLGDIEEFYDCIGGIIGYQIMALELLSASKDRKHRPIKDKFVDFHVPNGLNLLEDTDYASQAALWGIEGLPELGEIYPIGGAGDRLGLVDSDTGESLPAALLPYCGRSLLEGLIRDLQAREFLHFKIFGRQCVTPVAIMTSSVKNNHELIIAICERLEWFGRGRENFRLFEQPLVPVVNAEDGKWLVSKSLLPVSKPGGHGAIWKLACDRGIFQWLYRHGRKGATVRQVSNVVAATDLTLMALAGIGLRHNKKLGFASCERRPGATEGVNVLIEKESMDGLWAYGITCIEYTEFENYGIPEPTAINGSLQASYPANTNILYVDLQAAEEVGLRRNASCLPGMVLNLKKAVSYVDHLGFECSAAGGRLECTMQNIADNFMNTCNYRRNKGIESELDTFIVYNERKRVTSSAKRKLKSEDRSLHQTPEGSLLDIMRNAHDLLSSCSIEVPKVKDNSEYLHSGPPFLIFLHPALGPFWDIIKQKFVGGSVSEGSELQIEVAEFLWEDVELDGSLIILADNIMGSTKRNTDDEQILHYGARCGRCKLQGVEIVNEGINWGSPSNVYWKHDVERSESLKIILHGNAEFEAKDVVLKGNHMFEVPDGHRMCITKDKTGFFVKLDPISKEMMNSGTWYWKYTVDGAHVKLNMRGFDYCFKLMDVTPFKSLLVHLQFANKQPYKVAVRAWPHRQGAGSYVPARTPTRGGRFLRAARARGGRYGGGGQRVRGQPPGGARVAEQGRQRVAADGGDVRGHPVHAGAGGAVRQHREEEVGRELGLHGALRLRVVAAGVGARGVPHGVWGAAAAVLGQGRRGALPGLPRRPRRAVGHRARVHAGDGALLPGGHAGALPVRVRRHHTRAARRLRAGPHEHQGLDGLHAALAPPLLHRRRLQPLGRRLPLPLGRHRLLRRIRHPPLLRHRRLHRRLLGGPEAEERPRTVLAEQHPADDRRRRAAVDGLGRVQRRRAVRRQHHGVGGRAQHQPLRRHEPPHVDLPRRHLLQQAVGHRRRPGHDDRPRLHHPGRRAGADLGGCNHGHLRRQRPVVHHDDPAQEVGAAHEGRRHPRRLPHPRRRGPPRRHPHGTLRHPVPHGDRVPGARPPRRVLRRRHQADRQAAGRRGVRDRVEPRGDHAHPTRHRAVPAAADARRAAHDRRRRGARGGGLRAVGRRREVRRGAARRVEGRRRRGQGGLRGAAARRHGGQRRHHPAVGDGVYRTCQRPRAP